ncbi:MAG: hypothetical protein LBV41_03475 [Cytophagaceae bacterium]|jgi:hypothetical protein|nr:hypothetical protein [Cytophagaceae bacterium]
MKISIIRACNETVKNKNLFTTFAGRLINNKMQNTLFYIITTAALLTASCKPSQTTQPNPPIVTVDGYTLTMNDIKKGIPENLLVTDSVAVVEDYINRWVKTRLTLRQAEQNLSPDEKNVEQKLDSYRTSLLVYLYQQKILEQKYTPLLTDSEIRQYYNEMQDNFTLQENIFKGLYIKVPKDSPNQNRLKQWYRSSKQEDLVNLEAYCYQYARQYDNFMDNWVAFRRINRMLPEQIPNEDRFLQWNKSYEAHDSLFNYYISIHEYMLTGVTAPLTYVERRIKAILLNKKRGEFIQQLEQDLYDDAQREKIIKFH